MCKKLTLEFHLNSVNCMLDSPDQGIKGVPAKLDHTAQQAGYAQDVTERYCTAQESLSDELKAGRNPEMSNHNLPTELEENLQITIAQSNTPYMRYSIGLDLTDRLGNITCPVLALNGTKDRQVNCEENINALLDGLVGQKEIRVWMDSTTRSSTAIRETRLNIRTSKKLLRLKHLQSSLHD